MIKNYGMYIEKMKTLIDWAQSYYVLDRPKATDAEYDKLYHEIKDYEDKNPTNKLASSPTTTVGGVSGEFKKHTHKNRMWSQNDIFTKDELIKWLASVYTALGNTQPKFNLQPKYDGLSLKLTYEHGLLVRAVTRGDGVIGEDVTANAMRIRKIPRVIKFKDTIDINGEVMMPFKDFESINEQRLDEGKELFANPRNAAAGSVRLLDSNEVGKRRLIFYPWSIDSENVSSYLTVEDKMKLVEELGFAKSTISKTVNDIDSIMKHYEHLIKVRSSLPIGLDGMVIKVNDCKLHDKLGYTSKFPKWACAFKFPAIEKVTTILDIVPQVGKTGVITPVAILTPTEIDGSMVSRATLHNYVEVYRKDYRIGDQVVLIKSGDIIPKLIKIFKDRRTPDIVKFIPPKRCPNCYKKLTKENVYLRCTNPDCSSQVYGKIVFFGNRDHMNINGLGESVVKDLVDNNLVREVTDLYYLSYEKLEMLDGFQEKRINNLLKAIEATKGTSIDKVIASLGIPTVGRTVCKTLMDKFGLKFYAENKDTIMKVKGIGEEIANNIVQYYSDKEEFLWHLLNIIQPTVKETIITKSNYTGKNIVLTGTVKMGRTKFKELLENQGAKVTSTVTGKTDILFYDEPKGKKYNTAIKLGKEVKEYKEV